MRKLLDMIDPNGNDILCQLEKEGDVVGSEWVKPHLESSMKKSGTLILYLTSYIEFLTLVTHERFNKAAPPIHPNHLPSFKSYGLVRLAFGDRQSIVCSEE